MTKQQEELLRVVFGVPDDTKITDWIADNGVDVEYEGYLVAWVVNCND
jgi:hypothetical protein